MLINYEELNALLTQADELNNTGNFEEAEILVNNVLAELDKSNISLENQTVSEGQILHCHTLISLSELKWRRGDLQKALTLALTSLDLTEKYNIPESKAKALGNCGIVYWNLSDYANALMYYQKSLANYEEIGSKKGTATNLGNIGLVYYYLSDYTQSLKYFQKALAIYEEIGSKKGIATNLGNIGMVYSTLSDYAQSLTYFQKGLAINTEIGRKNGIASSLGNIGNVYLNLSDYSQAIMYFQKTMDIYDEIGSKAGIAAILNNIGMVYDNLSDYSQSLEYFQKAMAINEEIGSKHGIAGNLSNIGGVYFSLSDYSNALTYHQKAMAIHEEIGSKGGIAISLGNIGIVYYELSDYAQSLTYFQKALAIDQEIGSKNGIANHFGNIGMVYSALSDYTQSITYYQKSLAIDEEIGRKDGIVIKLGNIGGVYATRKYEGYDALRAEEYLRKAIEISVEIRNKEYALYMLLSDLYKEEKRWKEAYDNFEKFHSLKEEVKSEEATKQVQLMEHRRKIEESERDRQIKLARFQEQEKILYNILPSQIAERMISGEKTIVDSYECVSVLFADIVGFTKLSQKVTPEQLVESLDGIFNSFDRLADKHGCEKIKTIGDCYMVVAGLPERCDDHAMLLGAMALDMLKAIDEFPAIVENVSIKMRIGIHTGSVVAGIIGKNKYSYDLWGDAVNTASRMESHGEAGKIHVSEEFTRNISQLLSKRDGFQGSSPFSFTLGDGQYGKLVERGDMDIKGKGMMKTYFLEKAKP